MLWMQYGGKKFNCAMWQNQKFLCIGLGPVSVSACRGSSKQLFDLKGDGGAFSWVCVDKGGCCCWSGGVVGCWKSRQQNRAKTNNKE